MGSALCACQAGILLDFIYAPPARHYGFSGGCGSPTAPGSAAWWRYALRWWRGALRRLRFQGLHVFRRAKRRGRSEFPWLFWPQGFIRAFWRRGFQPRVCFYRGWIRTQSSFPLLRGLMLWLSRALWPGEFFLSLYISRLLFFIRLLFSILRSTLL